MSCLTRDLLRENERLQEEAKSLKEINKKLGTEVAILKEREATAYDIENPIFQEAMLPFVKESVEIAIWRFIERGFAKDEVEGVPFVELFPELEHQVAEMEDAAKGKAVVDEDEEEDGEEEEEKAEEEVAAEDAGSTQRKEDKSAVSASSTASSDDGSPHSEFSDSESTDGSGTESEGYSLIANIDGSPSPDAPPVAKKFKRSAK
ncbi:hypothetical protein KSP39_PZI004294 [Platanthera zijinensis]|uniref:Uncharacterized protein n=1 Tax=Platanthera zijinensis TaxID=2320716 RepID=A0AAP0BX22_9ASPA